jgi:peptidylprolyl isomerase
MNHVDAIQKGEPPADPTRILQASIGADKLAPPAGVAVPAPAPVPGPAHRVDSGPTPR